MQQAQVYVRGNNLLTISKEKDKLLLNIGRTPQMRGISHWLKCFILDKNFENEKRYLFISNSFSRTRIQLL